MPFSGPQGHREKKGMTDRPLVLSLFPGIGLLDRAFEEEGFCVVRGPDLLWGGDVKRFHPPAGKFDGVIGGPPCQLFSELEPLNEYQRRNGKTIKQAENLIPEFERIVATAAPFWFLMENVPNAPLPNIDGFGTCERLVRDVWVGGETNRLRRFSFGWRDMANLSALLAFRVEMLALHTPNPKPAVIAASGGRTPRYNSPGKLTRRYRSGEIYKTRDLRAMCCDQGLPAEFLESSPLTAVGKRQAVGNGVPLPMGRAVAKAVRQAMGYELLTEAEVVA
jgi:DNA (cytosine-5)-methyltransferase 1